MLKRYKLYQCEWNDAHSEGGWKNLEDCPEPEHYPIRTVGWLIREDKHYRVFTQNISQNGKYSDTMTIPKSWTTKMTYIKGRDIGYDA